LVKYFLRQILTRRTPPFSRVLLIESGSRTLYENLIPGIYETYGDVVVDVVTCYAGAPAGLNPDTGTVFRVTDYPGPQGRRRLLAELRSRQYTVTGLICSAEPIMTKWKWWLAWKLPMKAFVLNENGDYFWLDRFHSRVILHFALYRAGLTGAGAVPTIARLLLFPLTLAYLILFAAWVHLKRAVRLRVNA
jgi:hypothetical protein